MTSHRIGGLAVALGIGSALVAGHGVASAETSDGPSGAESSSASSASTDSANDTASEPDASTSATEPGDREPSEVADTETASEPGELDDEAAEKDEPVERKRSSRTRLTDRDDDADTESTPTDDVESDKATGKEPTPETLDEPRPATSSTRPADASLVTVSPTAEPLDPPVTTDAKPPNPVHTATVAISEAVRALLNPFPGDAPTSPIEAATTWTLAAAARREISTEPTNLDQPAQSVTTGLTLAAVDAPVVAITQAPPLAWLQHLPVVGPVLVTPLVAALHQIPIVSDILHPFIGYPVQFGLPAGGPAPRDVKVISFDGTPIYVHFMPARGLAAGQTAPTILNGPGLGLPGATNIDGTFLDDVLVDTFGILSVGTLRHAGYNVVTWDPRGEWNSGGRLELNAAEFEGRDMSAIISWLATQPEVHLDAPGDPRLGMVGVSYGGGIQLVTAANDTRVDAIVPSITYHSLTTSLYPDEAFKTSWATPLTAILALTLASTNPRVFPAAVYGVLTGQMVPSDQDLLESRDPVIENITVPTLLIQGTVDTLFSLQEADDTAQILLANAVPTKVVWFCGGHGVCAHNLFDLSDGELIERRTLQWLARYVKGDASVSTGPQFEWVDQRGQWYSSDTYPVAPDSPLVVSGGAGATLPLLPYLGGSGIPFVPFALKAVNAVNVRVPRATETTYVVGAPELTLTYSGTGSSRHVYAQLVDDRTGLVLGSIATPIPVILDGGTHTVTVDLEPVAHTLRPGESLTLQLVGSAGLYEKVSPSLGVLNVASLQLRVPTADAAAISAPSTVLLTPSAA